MLRSAFSALSLTAGLLASSAFAAPGRLPTGVMPISYDISVDPDATKLTFTGSETIAIQVTKPTSTITLNAADLTISRVMLDGRVAAKVAINAAAQTATFTFPKPVTAGKHSLSMNFAGKINRSAAGLFAIDYDAVTGGKERMLVTQFEAPDARRFAPMWDEPGIKTTFTLRASAPAGEMAFSNMPVTKKTAGANGETVWHFAQSPKMSSYLLFLGMGNVERKAVMAGNVEIGVITRKGVVDQGDYALASGKRLLAAFNDYFGQPYPLPKLDMIAGPGSSQFFGAMENWGAIFYFERTLLIDPKLTTESQKQDVFGTVAHEIAHQWFGNLVTMSWWDDLWLNEGFASWMASKISDDLNPEWGALSQTLAGDRQVAYALDSRSTTHPIIQKITTVDQISQAFDHITYRKGEAVIRMLEGAVGPDAFRTGVRSYMAKHKYANTITDQLWAEVGAAAGTRVKPMMDSFTLQGGVPLIRVAEPVCAGGATAVALSQDRFGLDAESKMQQTWIVPVRIGIAGKTEVTRLNVSGPNAVNVKVPGCGLTVVNRGQSAYFRTLYTPAHNEALRAGFTTLALDDQIGFAADSLALANGGYQPIDRYLALIDSIPADGQPLVWSLVAGQMGAIDRVLTGAPQQAAFRAKARNILAPVFARLGWTAKAGEAPADAQLRGALIPVLGTFGDPAVIAEAGRYAEQVFTDPDSVPGAIRIPALNVFGRSADQGRWEKLYQRAKAETNPVAKRIAYRDLASVQDAALARRTLAIALTDEAPVPMRADIIDAVSARHPAMAFDWAVANAEAVNALLETSTRSDFIVGLASSSGDLELAKRVTAYAEKALPEASRKPARDTVSTITYRAGLRAMQAATIGKWAAK